jgi:hypothetical protein
MISCVIGLIQKFWTVKEFYENYLKPTGKLRTKVSVHIWSKSAIKSVSTNSSINIDEIYKKFPIVKKGNRDEFVKSMKLYPCTYTPPRNLCILKSLY